MELVKQSFEILEQEIPVRKLDDSNESYKNRYLESMYKHIERCGKTCYRAEHNITEDSYKRFVQRMIDSRHFSVLEHGVIYLLFRTTIDSIRMQDTKHYHNDLRDKYANNPYSKVDDSYYVGGDYQTYVTTTYRVIVENGWEDDLQFICEPTEFHEKRYTVLLHSCIHCYKDLTRHRKMSFSIESTRYVNYSRTERFGEMKFVLPPWLDLPEGSYEFSKLWDENNWEWLLNDEAIYVNAIEHTFLTHLSLVKCNYNKLIDSKWQPQQAAEILPQCTAADVVMSGYSSDWMFIFRLRTSYIHETGQPHPLVREIMDPLYKEFVDKRYIDTSNV